MLHYCEHLYFLQNFLSNVLNLLQYFAKKQLLLITELIKVLSRFTYTCNDTLSYTVPNFCYKILRRI